jgi:hypothetical protein
MSCPILSRVRVDLCGCGPDRIFEININCAAHACAVRGQDCELGLNGFVHPKTLRWLSLGHLVLGSIISPIGQGPIYPMEGNDFALELVGGEFCWHKRPPTNFSNDEEGKAARMFRNLKPVDAAEQILNALRGLGESRSLVEEAGDDALDQRDLTARPDRSESGFPRRSD